MTIFNKCSRIKSFVLGAAIFMAGALSILGQKPLSIAEVQGNRGVSPYEKSVVSINGIVTAISKNGFYVQTPDDLIDKDPETSEAIFVYGPKSVPLVAVGNAVQVVGTVTEFRPAKEAIFLSITELTQPTVKVISKTNPLPIPIVLTPKELDPRGRPDQLERFEAMRVRADVTVVAPTSKGYTNSKTGLVASDGVFFAALQGTPRPMREPGVPLFNFILNKLPATTPVFDMNPEMLRVDSNAQTGAKTMDVTSGATIKNLTGVIEFARGFYTLNVDAANPPIVENMMKYVGFSPAAAGEVTVGSFNIENFFDNETNSPKIEKETLVSKDAFEVRLKKVSRAIRDVLSMPDVLGIVEVENLKVLQKVADRINTDAKASGKGDPKYAAYLESGNDFRGINVGFLVKTSKVKVLEVKQLAKDEKLGLLNGNPNDMLFDRPPLLLKAEVTDEQTQKTFVFSTIVNHFKSFLGVDSADQGNRVQNKRRLEAEWLAKYLEELEAANPDEPILVCGDLNAFQFNDGYNDLVGILKGKSDQNVLTPSKTQYKTGLINLIEKLPDEKERYSYVYDGSAQVLDHLLINRPMIKHVLKVGFARLNADFPIVYANDPDRPERISDHDAPMVFLSIEPKTAKP